MTKRELERLDILASRCEAMLVTGVQSIDVWRGDMRAVAKLVRQTQRRREEHIIRSVVGRAVKGVFERALASDPFDGISRGEIVESVCRALLESPPAVDAVDPYADSTGKPTTRDTEPVKEP